MVLLTTHIVVTFTLIGDATLVVLWEEYGVWKKNVVVRRKFVVLGRICAGGCRIYLETSLGVREEVESHGLGRGGGMTHL